MSESLSQVVQRVSAVAQFVMMLRTMSKELLCFTCGQVRRHWWIEDTWRCGECALLDSKVNSS